jgi:murein DD-endopeptidase MepM/ murein hydrolase activator NlpD
LDPRTALSIAPPMRGSGWINLNSCCDASMNHRSIREVLDAERYIKPELFGIDWSRIENQQLHTGDGNQNDQYFGFGDDILSVAPGTVTAVRDDMPDQAPNQTPTGVTTLDDFIGNHVVVQIQPDVWALYAHLQAGSVAVRVGDQVTTGQVLGRLGNSGNSFGAHLHFQLSDGPVALTSDSVPFVFDRYTITGIVDVAAVEAASEAPEGAGEDVASVPINVASAPQAGTYPLALTVQEFP